MHTPFANAPREAIGDARAAAVPRIYPLLEGCVGGDRGARDDHERLKGVAADRVD
jgi:hypothetical protein